MTGSQPVTDEAVSAALAAVAPYQREAREAAWSFPSSGQVRAMLEAAAPVITAPAEARLAAVRDRLRAEHGSWVRMADLWAIIGDEEADRG